MDAKVQDDRLQTHLMSTPNCPEKSLTGCKDYTGLLMTNATFDIFYMICAVNNVDTSVFPSLLVVVNLQLFDTSDNFCNFDIFDNFDKFYTLASNLSSMKMRHDHTRKLHNFMTQC